MKSIRKNFLKPFLFLCFGLMIATFAIAKNPFEEPGKPIIRDAFYDGYGCCGVKFDSPSSDGGSAILWYIIEMREKGEPNWTKSMIVYLPAPEVVIVPMYGGKEVQFRIKAVNRAGESEPSDASDIVILP